MVLRFSTLPFPSIFIRFVFLLAEQYISQEYETSPYQYNATEAAKYRYDWSKAPV